MQQPTRPSTNPTDHHSNDSGSRSLAVVLTAALILGGSSIASADHHAAEEPASTEKASTKQASTKEAKTEPANSEQASTEQAAADKASAPTAADEPEAEAAEYRPEFPLGLDPDMFNVPEDNPLTEAKVDLGRMLYFDGRLSSDGSISCASCHHPSKGFADGRKTSAGVDGKLGGRNAPTVINTAYNYFQFWDGRAPTLEEQAKGPIENPIEMATTHDAVVETIAGVEGYAPLFEAAFGDSTVDIDRIAKAIASYERTVLSGNSAWDRFVYADDKTALSESAQRGLELFEGKALCTRCHVGFNLTDGIFHNIGVGMDAEEVDLGRYEVTKEEKDRGAFKTPILRDISRTAPYMHDGSLETLEEVIEFYDRGGEPNKWLDPKMAKLGLSDTEKADLLAFLLALDGDWDQDVNPVLPE